MTEAQLKLKITEAGITVHRNMKGPVDSIHSRAVIANTRYFTDTLIDNICQQGFNNFAFYKFMQQSGTQMIRYAAW